MLRLRKLFRYEQTSALLMIAALLAALIAANSPLAALYQRIHHLPVHIRFGPLAIEEPLVQWINEGLMVLFFLIVGLEIKRQFIEGHLATFKCAVLPAIAAFGGMLVPAAVYLGFNGADPISARGWAIPIATDIVLALGVLSLLGSRVPTGLKVFLTALAIFDDIGVVLIIGLFYGEGLFFKPLLLLGLGVGGLMLLNALSITRVFPYVVIGLLVWVAMLKSGIEASLAGVIIALAIPMRSTGCLCSSPLRETERRIHPWCVLVVVPLFALFNAGITIDDNTIGALWNSVPLGVVGGLFVGKQLGVFGATFLAVRLGVGQLPRGVAWRQVLGVAGLAGIGFTMSLFVAPLAFADAALVASSKLAILLGSVLSGLLGIWVMHNSLRPMHQGAEAAPEVPS